MRPLCTSILRCLLILAGLCLCGLARAQAPVRPDGDEDVLREIDRMMNVLQLIRKNYVDIDKVSTAELFKGALAGMVESLDDFSNFLPPPEFQSLMDDTDGQFGGIGVTVNALDGRVVIVSVVKDGPGYKAGLQVGDAIHAVDGIRLTQEDASNMALRLRGKAGTRVKVSVLRPDAKGAFDEGAPLEFDIERAMIKVPSILAAQVLEGGVGFVRIKQFMEPTADDLRKVLMDFEKQMVNGLIMDLRGNPGGLLESAVAVCSMFLPTRSLVVTVKQHSDSHENRESERYHEHFSVPGYHFNDKVKMIVLIDGESASASEITAACLRDHRRAVLMGERSFGKGSVQSIIDLDDGSAIKLTVARYYPPDPKRPTIDGNGIEPDIRESLNPNVIPALDAGFEEGRVNLELDAQLARALEVLKSFPVLNR